MTAGGHNKIIIEGYAQSQHPLYATFHRMRTRCYNSNTSQFKDYGGRGIGICSRWSRFANFVEDMGPRPPGTSLDRKNNDKGYSPANCQWATPSQQVTNRRNLRADRTGVRCVVKDKNAYRATYYVGGGSRSRRGQQYHLGIYQTIKEAGAAYRKFARLYKNNDERCWELVGTSANRRLARTSTTKIKGVTKHPDGGYVVRKTVEGTRLYLGYVTDIRAAKQLLEKLNAV